MGLSAMKKPKEKIGVVDPFSELAGFIAQVVADHYPQCVVCGDEAVGCAVHRKRVTDGSVFTLFANGIKGGNLQRFQWIRSICRVLIR